MEGYTDTLLIDCNRINSEEKKGGNTSSPAIFTNKIGTGVKLNVGDKVSVHSGFISERGAGGDVIELTGKKKDYTYTLKESVLSLFQPRYAIAIDGEPHTGRMGELQPYNHHCSVITPTEQTYTLQDNIGHIQINYYKTTNGEGYFHLPRRYDAHKAAWNENPIDLWRDSATHPTNPAPDGEYSPDDGIPCVPYWYSLYNSNTANTESNGKKCDRYDNGRVMSNWAYKYSRCLDDIEYYNLPGIDEYDGIVKAGSSRIYKKKNDNSRYTLFTKEISYWAEWRCVGKFVGDPNFTRTIPTPYTENETASRGDYGEHGVYAHGRDPALSGYDRYNEIKEINIDTLHSAPENIASSVTNQLNNVVTDEAIRGEVGGTFITGEADAGEPLTKYKGRETRNTLDYYSETEDGQQSMKGVDIGRRIESECFKTFPCANARTFDQHHYQAFWQDKSANPDIGGMGRNAADLQDKVQNYLSAYSTIGVKRADLFEVGREVAAMSPGNNAGVPIKGVGAGNDDADSLLAWRDMWNPWIMNGAVTDVPQNPTSTDILGSTRATTDVILSYEWNDDNLQLLKRYFDTQAKYPELWTGYNGGNAGLNDSIIKTEGLLNTNSRFWHMNPVDGSSTDTNNQLNSLGNDNYENGQGTTPTTGTFTNRQSLPLFFYHDESRKDVASGGHNENELYYGMFIRRRAHFPTDAHQYDCIGVTTKKVGGVPDYFWGQGSQLDSSPPTPGAADAIGHSFTRTIGVDIHFNAYGTDAICLYSGLLDATPLNKDPDLTAGVPDITSTPREFPNQVYYAHDEAAPQPTMDQGWYNTSTQIRERYCGANQVELNFDTSASRFNFQLLHTPETIGNPNQAGFPASTGGNDAVAELEGAKNPVVKVNKRLFPHEFCPDMIPYTSSFGSKFVTNNKAGATDGNIEGENIQEPLNSNLSTWGIYDADSGIFIDDFGITDETMWNDSLWGILGFSYNQFNSATTLSRQARITNSVVQDNIGAITTNANVDAGEVQNLAANINGVPLFASTIGTQLACNFQNYAPGWGTMPPNREIPPAITIDATNNSAQVNAANLPRKMLRPYFLVKSNIIGDVNYLGGDDSGQGLPIMYVVNKENGFGDFYFGAASSNEFTITKEKTISSITTSIHEADFSLAAVDENSAIIYKITKEVNANLNVAEEVMKSLKKK
jgi:hypothetical protein